MGFDVNTIKERDPVSEGAGKVYRATEHLWADNLGNVVPNGDERAAILLCAPGDEIPVDEAEAKGLLDYDPDSVAAPRTDEEMLAKIGESEDADRLQALTTDPSEAEEVRHAAAERLEQLGEEVPEPDGGQLPDTQKLQLIAEADNVEKLRDVAANEDESDEVRKAAQERADQLEPEPEGEKQKDKPKDKRRKRAAKNK